MGDLNRERQPNSNLNLFDQQFAETWDKDKNDQTKSSNNIQNPSSRHDNKHTGRANGNAHDSSISRPIERTSDIHTIDQMPTAKKPQTD